MGMAFWKRVSQIEHFALLMAFRYLRYSHMNHIDYQMSIKEQSHSSA
jgi:hypothetical protein